MLHHITQQGALFSSYHNIGRSVVLLTLKYGVIIANSTRTELERAHN